MTGLSKYIIVVIIIHQPYISNQLFLSSIWNINYIWTM